MEQMERVERVSELLGKVEGYDEAAYAVLWTEIGALAVSGLKDSGVEVLRDESRHQDDEIPPPPVMGWAMDPGELVRWCDAAGFDPEWVYDSRRVKAALAFDGKPDSDVRAALKAAGFSYKKSQRRWLHGMWGTSPRCVEKRQAELAELAEEPEVAEGGAAPW